MIVVFLMCNNCFAKNETYFVGTFQFNYSNVNICWCSLNWTNFWKSKFEVLQKWSKTWQTSNDLTFLRIFSFNSIIYLSFFISFFLSVFLSIISFFWWCFFLFYFLSLLSRPIIYMSECYNPFLFLMIFENM